MHIITIKKTDDDLELFLPSNINEVSLRAKLDFDDSIKTVMTYLASIVDNLEKDSPAEGTGYYLYLLCKGLTDFFIGQGQEVDLNDFLNIDVSELLEDGELKSEVLSKHIESYENKEPLNVEDVFPTILGIWEYVANLCNNYTPNKYIDQDLSFEYKGEVFKVFRRTVDSLYGEKFSKVSVGELTESFEISRKLAKLGESPSVKLTEMLGLISILARKEGEKLPLDDVENFIESRSKFFIDIPYTTAVEVFFYLTPSLNTFLKEKIWRTFLTPQNLIEETTKSQSTNETK